jgi:murein DD-endopeptidase / murein LD-carboxypeptidase
MAQWELSASPLPIPPRFHGVPYNGAHYPGAAGVNGLEGGANCQQFAYELIRHYGCVIPDFRSSELWADTVHTCVADPPAPLDLMLFHKTPDAWGAHAGVFLGEGLVIHLAKQTGVPVIWDFADFALRPEYACYIGAKRPLKSGMTTGVNSRGGGAAGGLL